jgi:hypothetical protein
MPEYRRPSLIAANPAEVSDHLASKAIESSTRLVEGDALYITIAGTSADLDAALVDFANTGKVPIAAELRAPVQTIRDLRQMGRNAFMALTAAERDRLLYDAQAATTTILLALLRE